MIPIHPDYRETLRTLLLASDVPDHMHEGIIEHVMDGAPTGGFLTAVLEGDLFGACRAADHWNRDRLFSYAQFFYQHLPTKSYGTPERVSEWIGSGGIMGAYNRDLLAAAARKVSEPLK